MLGFTGILMVICIVLLVVAVASIARFGDADNTAIICLAISALTGIATILIKLGAELYSGGFHL